MARPDPGSITTRPARAKRSLGAVAILAPWLLLISSRQVQLYAGEGGGPPRPELLPMPVVLAAIAVALILPRIRPSVAIHVACLAVAVSGVALLAASLGTPFADATAEYCGDLCRTQIMFRTAAFVGWPALASAGLALQARADLRAPDALGLERAEWSRAWVAPTLILGYLASATWWQLVLS